MTKTTAGLASLRNLGPASRQMLGAAGIDSADKLRQLGPVRAYLAVKGAGCSPSLNLLWAIAGALSDRDWREISRTERTGLLLLLDDCSHGAG